MQSWFIKIYVLKLIYHLAMSQRLKWINVPYRPDLQTSITYLDSYYIRFIHAYGCENTQYKKFLEIKGNTVRT